MVSAASYFLMLQKYINSKQKISEIKGYALCLGKKNFLKDFTINNMKKKKKNKRRRKFLSVDCNAIDTNDILDIHKYLMKGTLYKIMLRKYLLDY